jgi:hypothetical protein
MLDTHWHRCDAGLSERGALLYPAGVPRYDGVRKIFLRLLPRQHKAPELAETFHRRLRKAGNHAAASVLRRTSFCVSHGAHLPAYQSSGPSRRALTARCCRFLMPRITMVAVFSQGSLPWDWSSDAHASTERWICSTTQTSGPSFHSPPPNIHQAQAHTTCVSMATRSAHSAAIGTSSAIFCQEAMIWLRM